MPLHPSRGAGVLIIHQGAIGDFILALPAFRALRDFLRPANVGIMAHSWNLPLVHRCLYADETFDVNQAEIAPFFQDNAPLPASVCHRLKNYNVAFIFGTSRTFAANMQRGGIDRVCLLPPFPADTTHLTDHHLRTLASIGIKASGVTPAIYPSRAEIEWAKRYLRDSNLTPRPDRPLVALHPGAGSIHKAWSPTRFAALGRLLHAFGFCVLLISGPADGALTGDALASLPEVPCVLLRDLPLNSLAAILQQSALYVGNDSGISHLAAAVGIPTIAIFGPTDPRIWAPRGRFVRVLSTHTSCAPCTLEMRQRCTQKHCLQEITIRDVLLSAADFGIRGLPSAPPEQPVWSSPRPLTDTSSESLLGH